MRVFTLTKIRCHFSTAWKRFRASPASKMCSQPGATSGTPSGCAQGAAPRRCPRHSTGTASETRHELPLKASSQGAGKLQASCSKARNW